MEVKEQLLEVDSIKDLVDKYDYFLCDCDGVLYSGANEIGCSFGTI